MLAATNGVAHGGRRGSRELRFTSLLRNVPTIVVVPTAAGRYLRLRRAVRWDYVPNRQEKDLWRGCTLATALKYSRR